MSFTWNIRLHTLLNLKIIILILIIISYSYFFYGNNLFSLFWFSLFVLFDLNRVTLRQEIMNINDFHMELFYKKINTVVHTASRCIPHTVGQAEGT